MKPFDRGYLRSAELRSLGIAVGDGVMIARDCTIIGRENITIGDNVRIDGPTVIAAAKGSLTLGSHIHIGGFCYLACAGGLTLEDFAGLSQGVKIYTASDDYSGATLTNPTISAAFKAVKMAPVHLGRHIIVGSGAVILPGVEIGEGASVGALSLVGKSLEPWGVYAGQPARRIRERKRDLLALEARFLAEWAARSPEPPPPLSPADPEIFAAGFSSLTTSRG